MTHTIKKIAGIEIPKKFQYNIDVAKAYFAGITRARNPELLETSDFDEIRGIDGKFFGKTGEILTKYISHYEATRGRDFITAVFAYASGKNIDKEISTRRIGKPTKPMMYVGEERPQTILSLDTILNRMRRDPQFIPNEAFEALTSTFTDDGQDKSFGDMYENRRDWTYNN